MSDWQNRINLALREINQAQVKRRIAPEEYRRCRRQLLVQAIHFSSSADTLRRGDQTQRVPALVTAPVHQRGAISGAAMPAVLRSWALWLWGACMLLGGLALYWYWGMRH